MKLVKHQCNQPKKLALSLRKNLMRYYLVSGEKSADLHASKVAREIKQQDPDAYIRYWGGEETQKYADEQVTHYRKLTSMGFNLWHILKHVYYLRYCKKDIRKYQPDIVLLIDYGSFNLRIAKYAKRNKIPVVYYILPKIWAWGKSRLKYIQKYVDCALSIFPFEASFYKAYNYTVHYVGNPTMDHIMGRRNQNGSPKPQKPKKNILLAPGSRIAEVKHHIPILLEIAQMYQEHHFIMLGVKHIPKKLYASVEAQKNISLIYENLENVQDTLQASIVVSGTITLELALYKIPQIMIYKTSYWNYWIAKYLVRVPYISLVNLLVDEYVIKELIQQDCNAKEIKKALEELLESKEHRIKQIQTYEKIIQQLTVKEEVAKQVVKYIMYTIKRKGEKK